MRPHSIILLLFKFFFTIYIVIGSWLNTYNGYEELSFQRKSSYCHVPSRTVGPGAIAFLGALVGLLQMGFLVRFGGYGLIRFHLCNKIIKIPFPPIPSL